MGAGRGLAPAAHASAHENIHAGVRYAWRGELRRPAGRGWRPEYQLPDAIRLERPLRSGPSQDRRSAACRGEWPGRISPGRESGGPAPCLAGSLAGVFPRRDIGCRGGLQFHGAQGQSGRIPRLLRSAPFQRRSACLAGRSGHWLGQPGPPPVAGRATLEPPVAEPPHAHHLRRPGGAGHSLRACRPERGSAGGALAGAGGLAARRSRRGASRRPLAGARARGAAGQHRPFGPALCRPAPGHRPGPGALSLGGGRCLCRVRPRPARPPPLGVCRRQRRHAAWLRCRNRR